MRWIMGVPVVRASVWILADVDPAALELERHVPDAEPIAHPGVDLLEDALVPFRILDHRVPAHREDPAGHGPDVEVVHLRHPGDLRDGAMNLPEVDVPGHGFEEHVYGLAHELPAADQDQDPDEH